MDGVLRRHSKGSVAKCPLVPVRDCDEINVLRGYVVPTPYPKDSYDSDRHRNDSGLGGGRSRGRLHTLPQRHVFLIYMNVSGT